MAVHASLVLLAQPLLELGATTTAVAPVRLARLGWIRGDSTNARSSAGFKFQTCVIGMPLGMEYQIKDEKHRKRKRNEMSLILFLSAGTTSRVKSYSICFVFFGSNRN